MKKLTLLPIALSLLVSLNFSQKLYAGESTGGFGSLQASAASVEIMINSGGLKQAMINYLNTVNATLIDDKILAQFFTADMKKSLIADIETPHIYDLQKKCVHPDSKQSVPAYAKIGDRGGKICVSAETIAGLYSNLGAEDFAVQLASIALHEHLHHLQSTDRAFNLNEADGAKLSGYIQLTARIVQMPSLEWSLSESTEECENFDGVYSQVGRISEVFESERGAGNLANYDLPIKWRRAYPASSTYLSIQEKRSATIEIIRLFNTEEWKDGWVSFLPGSESLVKLNNKINNIDDQDKTSYKGYCKNGKIIIEMSKNENGFITGVFEKSGTSRTITTIENVKRKNRDFLKVSHDIQLFNLDGSIYDKIKFETLYKLTDLPGDIVPRSADDQMSIGAYGQYQ